jgi:ectoine hydroxylase-related dioxygenase (phytanoyl-CoA dioxygenase family)
VQTFNALVGVYLQAVPEEFCGNLVVFPGSHALVAEATRDAATMELIRREGMPALHEKLPTISKPLQIIADAGDVIVAHSSLPHSVAPNVSSAIRYALYFRVNSTSR